MDQLWRGMVLFSLCVMTAMPVRSSGTIPVAGWTHYRSDKLGVRLAIPPAWTARKGPGALGFRTAIGRGGFAAFGVRQSSFPGTIDMAALNQYKAEGSPARWIQSTSTLCGKRAIKIIATMHNNPAMGMLQFYVETPHGTYLVQCVAPKSEWPALEGTFGAMLANMEFLDA